MTQIPRIFTDKNGEYTLHGNIKSKIIESVYMVYNTLGYGFLEKVYENALKYELFNHGFKVE